MKLCALVWLAALTASAQTYEIRGVLLEKATERPIRGSVMVYVAGTDRGASIETNASGEFQARLGPGTYSINFEGNDQYRRAFLQVEFAADERSKSVRVLVEKVGRVSGRVLDEATGQPVADVPVTTMQVYWIYGQLQADELPLRTDAEGRFEGAGERELPWVVGVKPKLVAPANAAENVITNFTDADFEATDEDYEETYWPGGVRVVGEAVPAPYVADQTMDLGNIRVRKMKYRRALVRFPVQDGCDEGQSFRARFVQPRDETRDFTVRCGQDQLLKGLIPGMQYRIEIAPDNQLKPELWRTGALDFVVGDRNPEVRVLLKRGVDLEGRLTFAEGSSAPKTPVSLMVKGGELWQERRLDKEGRFKFDSVPLGEQAFLLTSDDGHYAQRVRVNGAEAYGQLEKKFEWTGQGTLEVVIDDQPGTIQGKVKDGSDSAVRARVTVVPWLMPAGKSIFDLRRYEDTDPSGQYRMGMLPAGDYRVVAVGWEGREMLERPGALERLMAQAEKVTLGRGSAATLDVRVVDLK